MELVLLGPVAADPAFHCQPLVAKATDCANQVNETFLLLQAPQAENGQRFSAIFAWMKSCQVNTVVVDADLMRIDAWKMIDHEPPVEFGDRNRKSRMIDLAGEQRPIHGIPEDVKGVQRKAVGQPAEDVREQGDGGLGGSEVHVHMADMVLFGPLQKVRCASQVEPFSLCVRADYFDRLPILRPGATQPAPLPLHGAAHLTTMGRRRIVCSGLDPAD